MLGSALNTCRARLYLRQHFPAVGAIFIHTSHSESELGKLSLTSNQRTCNRCSQGSNQPLEPLDYSLGPSSLPHRPAACPGPGPAPNPAPRGPNSRVGQEVTSACGAGRPSPSVRRWSAHNQGLCWERLGAQLWTIQAEPACTGILTSVLCSISVEI